MDFAKYWQDVAAQDAEALRAWFTPDAEVLWPCTNERFTAAEFIRANCEYPGDWRGELLRTEALPDGAVTVARVWSPESSVSCHVTSFFRLESEHIATLTEYWADDGPPPAWRQAMGIGRAISVKNMI